MKALTIRQPYASLVVRGLKQIENRRQRTSIRGQVVIHAAKELHTRFSSPNPRTHENLIRSSILGTVQLVDCHNSETCAASGCLAGAEYRSEHPDPWERPIFHWVLENPREFVTPIPRVKGMLGFWNPTESDAYLVSIAEVKR